MKSLTVDGKDLVDALRHVEFTRKATQHGPWGRLHLIVGGESVSLVASNRDLLIQRIMPMTGRGDELFGDTELTWLFASWLAVCDCLSPVTLWIDRDEITAMQNVGNLRTMQSKYRPSSWARNLVTRYASCDLLRSVTDRAGNLRKQILAGKGRCKIGNETITLDVERALEAMAPLRQSDMLTIELCRPDQPVRLVADGLFSLVMPMLERKV